MVIPKWREWLVTKQCVLSWRQQSNRSDCLETVCWNKIIFGSGSSERSSSVATVLQDTVYPGPINQGEIFNLKDGHGESVTVHEDDDLLFSNRNTFWRVAMQLKIEQVWIGLQNVSSYRRASRRPLNQCH